MFSCRHGGLLLVRYFYGRQCIGWLKSWLVKNGSLMFVKWPHVNSLSRVVTPDFLRRVFTLLENILD
jgi:hypothetical protein